MTDAEFGVERSSCTATELLKNSIPLLHQTGAVNQQLVKPLFFKTEALILWPPGLKAVYYSAQEEWVGERQWRLELDVIICLAPKI